MIMSQFLLAFNKFKWKMCDTVTRAINLKLINSNFENGKERIDALIEQVKMTTKRMTQFPPRSNRFLIKTSPNGETCSRDYLLLCYFVTHRKFHESNIEHEPFNNLPLFFTGTTNQSSAPFLVITTPANQTNLIEFCEFKIKVKELISDNSKNVDVAETHNESRKLSLDHFRLRQSDRTIAEQWHKTFSTSKIKWFFFLFGFVVASGLMQSNRCQFVLRHLIKSSEFISQHQRIAFGTWKALQTVDAKGKTA